MTAIKDLEADIKSQKNNIYKIAGGVSTRGMGDVKVAQLLYMKRAVSRIFVQLPEYAKNMQAIQEMAAKVAIKSERMINGRVATPSRDLVHRTAREEGYEEELKKNVCARDEFDDKEGDCLIGNNNRAQINNNQYDPDDMNEVQVQHDSPRDPSMTDYNFLKAEVAYINLMQEQLLFDVEFDIGILEMVNVAQKSTKMLEGIKVRLAHANQLRGMAMAVYSTGGVEEGKATASLLTSIEPMESWDVSEGFDEFFEN